MFGVSPWIAAVVTAAIALLYMLPGLLILAITARFVTGRGAELAAERGVESHPGTRAPLQRQMRGHRRHTGRDDGFDARAIGGLPNLPRTGPRAHAPARGGLLYRLKQKEMLARGAPHLDKAR